MQRIKTIEALAVKVEMIHEDIKELTAVVKSLEEDLHRRRGAIKVLSALIAGLGAAVGWVASHVRF